MDDKDGMFLPKKKKKSEERKWGGRATPDILTNDKLLKMPRQV